MELPEKILAVMSNTDTPVESLNLAQEFNEDHQKIVGAIKSLECLGEIIQAEIKPQKQWQLTEEGQKMVDRGESHEAVVYSAVPIGEGISQQNLKKNVDSTIFQVGFNKALQQKWIYIDKESGGTIKRKVDSIADTVCQDLATVLRDPAGSSVVEKSLAEYKKRKLVQEIILKR